MSVNYGIDNCVIVTGWRRYVMEGEGPYEFHIDQ